MAAVAATNVGDIQIDKVCALLFLSEFKFCTLETGFANQRGGAKKRGEVGGKRARYSSHLPEGRASGRVSAGKHGCTGE